MSKESSGNPVNLYCRECDVKKAADDKKSGLEFLMKHENCGESSTDRSGQRIEYPEGSSKQATNKLGEPPKPEADAWLEISKNGHCSAAMPAGNQLTQVSKEKFAQIRNSPEDCIVKGYSGQTIRQTVTKVARELKEELENEVEDENIKSHRQDEINILASKIGEVFDPE